MAASVLQGRGPKERMQSMVEQTDVEMEKEEHGQMMSTGLQVLRPLSYCFSHAWFISHKILTNRVTGCNQFFSF